MWLMVALLLTWVLQRCAVSEELAQVKMDSLLENARDGIRRNKRSFPGLMADSIGIGFLGQAPMMPAITVVPDRTEIVQRQSGGRYTVARTIEIQIFEDDFQNESAERRLQADIGHVKELVRNDDGFLFKFRNQKTSAFNFDWGAITYSNVDGNLRGHKVRQATLPLIVYSREWRPAQNRKSKNTVRADDKAVLNAAFQRLYSNRFGRLQGVKEFNKHDAAPRGGGLTISIQQGNATVDRYGAGVDSFDIGMTITVWSKMAVGGQSLLANARISEAMLDIFEEDETLDSKVWNSEVQGIDFRSDELENRFFYKGILSLLGRKFESSLFGNK